MSPIGERVLDRRSLCLGRLVLKFSDYNRLAVRTCLELLCNTPTSRVLCSKETECIYPSSQDFRLNSCVMGRAFVLLSSEMSLPFPIRIETSDSKELLESFDSLRRSSKRPSALRNDIFLPSPLKEGLAAVIKSRGR